LASRQKPRSLSVAVFGLGRFGSAVAESLVRQGHDVLAVDERAELVERWADDLTHVVRADATDDQALDQLGVAQFDCAVVAIGADIEASVLTVLSLVEAGVPDIWAKAITRKHGKILTSVGAHHVVFPESSMGERVAHMLTGGMMDFIQFDDEFSIARTLAPEFTWDRTLAESAPRSNHGVTVVGVKRTGEDFRYALPDTSVKRHDQLIVSGPTDVVERFCQLR
jgi:trk system potassium uptake protein